MEFTWQALLIHILFYPVYQVLSTVRHELAHALAATLSGLKVTKVSVIPHVRDGRFCWGYTEWAGGEGGVHVLLAPYYVNVITLPFGVWFVSVLVEKECSLHLLVASAIMLVISPVIDTCHALLKWLVQGRGDFAQAWKSDG